MDSVVTKLNTVAERILDPANGKPCQTHYRARASEYIRELQIGRALTADSCIEHTRSSQRQTLSQTCRAMTVEHMREKRFGRYQTSWIFRENNWSRQRQTLSETVSGEGKWAYLWIDNGKYANILQMQREYPIEPTANPVRNIVGRWQASLFLDC